MDEMRSKTVDQYFSDTDGSLIKKYQKSLIIVFANL
jgi:hypothetical protein